MIGHRTQLPRPVETGEGSSVSLTADSARSSGITEAISHLPSIAVRRSGGEGSEPEFLIRGQDPRENRYFLEGVPLTDAEYQSAQLAAVPLDALSRIDVFPSGTPPSLASDGLGGALHFRLLPTEEPERARIRAGSYGLGEGVATIGTTSAKVTARGVFSDEDFVYFDDNGTPFNSGDDRIERRSHNRFRRVSLLPVVSGTGWSAFSLTSFAATEVPGPLQMPASADLKEGFQVVGVKGARGNWTGHGWFKGDWQKLTDPQRTLSTNYALATSTSLAAGGRSRWEWEGAGFLWGATGAIGWDGFRVSGTDGYASSRDRWTGSFALSADRSLGSAVFTPAVVGTAAYFPAGGGPTRHFQLLSPRVGLSWLASPAFKVRASAGRYYRLPALAELHGSPSGISPNPALGPELADKFEVGADTAAGPVKMSYTFSAAWARDLVTYLSNSQWTRVAVNIGRSRIFTQELGAQAALPLGFSAGASAVWMASENQSAVAYWNGKELPYRPRWRGETRVGWERGPVHVGYTASIWGALYEDLLNEKRRGTLIEHGIDAVLTTKDFGDWRMEAANLTDVLAVDGSAGAFRTVENTTGYLGYPAPGRRIYFSWRYAL